MTTIDSSIITDALSYALAEGRRFGFNVACGIVDGSGRTLGVLRHPDAIWPAADLALRKAVLASAFRGPTTDRFERWQSELPLFGAGLAALSDANGWFVAPGGSPIVGGQGQVQVCIGAVGVNGARPASLDQEIADAVAGFCASQQAL